MKHLIGFFTVISFFMWIQPLGAFIRPSLEQTVCGGNRAFHMCSMIQPGSDKRATSGVSFTASTTFEKTSKPDSAGSGGVTAPVRTPAGDFGDRPFLWTPLTTAPSDFCLSPTGPPPKTFLRAHVL